MEQQVTPEKRIGLGHSQAGLASSAPRSLSHSGAKPTPPQHPDPAPASPVTPASDASGFFGTTLEAALIQQCAGRLSKVNWFRTDWQRGGALTGFAHWLGPEGEVYDVMVKLPVPPREMMWLVRLQQRQGSRPVVPRIHAHGDVLGGYDLAWVVMERLQHGPLGQAWGGAAFELIVEATAHFYKAMDQHELAGDPLSRDWEEVIRQARSHIQAQSFPEAQRWKEALKKAGKQVRAWQKIWDDRPITDWVHGDLHLGNAMTRAAPPHGPAVLFDLAHVRPGNWVEDAVYFEHLYWSRPSKLDGHRIAAELARARRALGLSVDADWPQLAQVKRALFAMSAPIAMHHDGGSHHLHASLQVLERAVF